MQQRARGRDGRGRLGATVYRGSVGFRPACRRFTGAHRGAAVRYFRVAEIAEPCFHCESFVLPLSDPDAIAHAENLIANGPSIGGLIASARIVAGSDGINRNLNLPDEPFWSWHVVGFDGFGDMAIELCDGWPSFVESDVDAFINNTQGQICFWGWTVVDEVRGRAAIPVPAVSSGSLLWLMLMLGTLGAYGLRRSIVAGASESVCSPE